jgi:hypothetical protein
LDKNPSGPDEIEESVDENKKIQKSEIKLNSKDENLVEKKREDFKLPSIFKKAEPTQV